MEQKKLIRSYRRKIRKCFPTYGKREKEYLSKLQENMEEYSERVPDFKEEDLINEFGRPKDVVADYFSSVDDVYIRKKLRKAHYIRVIYGVLLVIVLFCTTIQTYRTYEYFQEMKMHNIDSEEVIIEYHW